MIVLIDDCAAIQALLLLRDQEGAGGEKFRNQSGAAVEALAQRDPSGERMLGLYSD
jgi:hypothetical protein